MSLLAEALQLVSTQEEASSQDDGEGRTEKDTAALKVQAGVRTVREPLVRVWLTVHGEHTLRCVQLYQLLS